MTARQSVHGCQSFSSSRRHRPIPRSRSALGMVLGLYGLLYLDVALRPAEGLPVAAVGLAGKVLGPLGWLWLALSGEWPWPPVSSS
ncbi:hypothetical protein JK359_10335 [Streptomyces actinomycinicus]|uniref:Uncharacterized protein n=1 Tax=Streptomyces actinomycinicus TaxID=1695166 RepID=A0A937JLF3_9ACTN|nr:hypothetical protein [Streptomyces actinomycinicus]MBL1082375.1 hypothetical protein [Streptomyces actinomycinicus]